MSIQEWENKAADYARLKQERAEAVAQFEVMREALIELRSMEGRPVAQMQADEALSLTPSAALREIRARAMEEAAATMPNTLAEKKLLDMAAAKRKGE